MVVLGGDDSFGEGGAGGGLMMRLGDVRRWLPWG